MISADKVTAIREKAEILAGQSLGEHGEQLVELAAQRACALCQREDIPEAMEQAVAALVAEQISGGSVKSVTRGDTAITYAAGFAGGSAEAQLAPFRRLGRLQTETGAGA